MEVDYKMDCLEEKLHYHPIELADQARVQQYLDYWNIKAAGLQFSTLYIWGGGGRIRIAEKEDALFILVAQKKGDMTVAPITTRPENYERIMQIAEADCRACGRESVFSAIPAQTAPCFQKMGYQLSEDRDSAEYVYTASDLRELPGKAYHGKRNHINAFLMNESYRYAEITPDMAAECMRVYDAWMEGKEGEEGLDMEKAAVQRALANMEQLGLVGGGIIVQDRLEAFSIGERVGTDTAVIHFEKALDKRGLFPLINRDFAANAFSDVQFINREEDMGEEGLRKAKLSYKPLRFESFFRACRK